MPKAKTKADPELKRLHVDRDLIAQVRASDGKPVRTPAPWVAVNTGFGQSVIRPADDGGCDEIVIAAVPRGGLLYQLVDQGYGNTLLICAAPDLLEAAKAARRALADLNGSVSREVWNGLYETTAILDTAIAKAESPPH